MIVLLPIAATCSVLCGLFTTYHFLEDKVEYPIEIEDFSYLGGGAFKILK
jgi:hypothetical protein